ncbi:MAG: winged helix-turn-helix domain-containing protein, partial [Pseudomonadota bacterium]
MEVEPQVFALLELLIRHNERVVSKEEINEQVWGGRIVSEAALNSRIRSARLAIGDNGKTQRHIKTIRERGFRFVTTVHQNKAAAPVTADVVLSPPQAAEGLQAAKPSIAVLPLQMLSMDSRYDALADAIAHEVIADLSSLRWLRVISRASSFRFRGAQPDLNEVSSTLQVDYVVSGSLAIFADKATVSVELADTRNHSLLWADNIERSLDELFELRTHLTTRITNGIEMRIQSAQAQLMDSLPTENLNAWACYFRALRHLYRFNAHDNNVAVHLLRNALSLDNQFALAHSGLSFAHFQNAFVGYTEDIERQRQLASEHADSAMQIDPLDPVINLAVGRAKMLDGNWEEAIPWFERCTTLSPNNAQSYYHQGLAKVITGQGQVAPELASQALSLSPIDPLQYAFLASGSLGLLAREELESACHWAEKAALAPGAHHLIAV